MKVFKSCYIEFEGSLSISDMLCMIAYMCMGNNTTGTFLRTCDIINETHDNSLNIQCWLIFFSSTVEWR